MKDDDDWRLHEIKVCMNCGSPHVSNDALAQWCMETQEWELAGLLQNADCESCGGECNIEALSLDDPAGYAAAEIASWDCDTVEGWRDD